MGIKDRDYMKRPPGDGDGGGRGRKRGRQANGTNLNPDGFLGANRRFLIFLGGGIAVLFMLKLLMKLLSE